MNKANIFQDNDFQNREDFNIVTGMSIPTVNNTHHSDPCNIVISCKRTAFVSQRIHT